MGVIAQPSTLRPYIGALTVVGAYDRLVVNCVIGRLLKGLAAAVAGLRSQLGLLQGPQGPLQVALVLTARRRWLCFGNHETVHRERLRIYVAGLRSQLGVPPPQPTYG